MSANLFKLAGLLPRADGPPAGLAKAASQSTPKIVVVDEMTATVYQEGDETIWVHLSGGCGGIHYWYGPGDLRNAEVAQLIDSLLK